MIRAHRSCVFRCCSLQHRLAAAAAAAAAADLSAVYDGVMVMECATHVLPCETRQVNTYAAGRAFAFHMSRPFDPRYTPTDAQPLRAHWLLPQDTTAGFH